MVGSTFSNSNLPFYVLWLANRDHQFSELLLKDMNQFPPFYCFCVCWFFLTSHLFLCSSVIYSFFYFHGYDYVTPLCMILSNIFCSTGLVDINSSTFCSSWQIFIMKCSIAGYSNLGWQLFSFRLKIYHSMSLSLLKFLFEKSTVILMYLPVCVTW
jgi:hypothetical protein